MQRMVFGRAEEFEECPPGEKGGGGEREQTGGRLSVWLGDARRLEDESR